jgi:SAM-dependent methyltransferase
MDPEAMKPYGRTLLDYHNGNLTATLEITRDDGLVTLLPINTFFRHALDIEIERRAIEMAHGYILDAGAGTGLHSLFLQEKGFKVCAIDISSEASQIMRERRVIYVRQADVMSLRGEKFDTIIMMGHGIGIVENLLGLDQFLGHVGDLLNAAGQILLTSLDVRVTGDPKNLAYQKKNTASGRYFGEIRMQFKYGNIIGPMFGWLHVDEQTLADHAYKSGWGCEVIKRQGDGNYLARLLRQ